MFISGHRREASVKKTTTLICQAVSQRLAQIFCQVLWMKDLSRRPVQQFFQAYKVFTLEFFIYKIPNRFSLSSRKQWTLCLPIIMSGTCRISWATIRPVFTELNYLDPLEIEHRGACFSINSNFMWFLSSRFSVDWCFDKPLFYSPIKLFWTFLQALWLVQISVPYQSIKHANAVL